MSREKLWAHLREKEREATERWLPEISSTVEMILNHYKEGDTSTPWIFDPQALKISFSVESYYYLHILKTNLKRDKRLNYFIHQPGNQEIFCPIDYCLTSVSCGSAPIRTANKIEVSDENAEYVDQVFLLAIFFTEFNVNRLKLSQNSATWIDVDEIIHLLQNPHFKTDLNLQSYSIDKIVYDVVGLMRSNGKLKLVETYEPKKNHYRSSFKLGPKYIQHCAAAYGVSRIYEVTVKLPVEEYEIGHAWRRYLARQKKRNPVPVLLKRYHDVSGNEENQRNKQLKVSGDKSITTIVACEESKSFNFFPERKAVLSDRTNYTTGGLITHFD